MADMGMCHEQISAPDICGRIVKRPLNRDVFGDYVVAPDYHAAFELCLVFTPNLTIPANDGIRPYPVTRAKLNARVNYGRSVDMVAVNVYPIRGVNAI